MSAFWTCYRCDVRWCSAEGRCWYCGKTDRLSENQESEDGVLPEGVPPIC